MQQMLDWIRGFVLAEQNRRFIGLKDERIRVEVPGWCRKTCLLSSCFVRHRPIDCEYEI